MSTKPATELTYKQALATLRVKHGMSQNFVELECDDETLEHCLHELVDEWVNNGYRGSLATALQAKVARYDKSD